MVMMLAVRHGRRLDHVRRHEEPADHHHKASGSDMVKLPDPASVAGVKMQM